MSENQFLKKHLKLENLSLKSCAVNHDEGQVLEKLHQFGLYDPNCSFSFSLQEFSS